ncbi:SdpI family protein [Chitinophaga vietnamensis]|uniref:SdpI family protein n=1 Tax=Chitinophaga vietnamensis TaxID=2593957 RepID=UPI001177DEB5|nr:SdpI family protein [Chitinophaga vietnamensis]
MFHHFIHTTWCNAALFVGLIFLGMGWFIKHYPPKSIKTWYGYRSVLSTRNPEMWQAANQDAAYISRRIGMVLIITGIICALLFNSQSDWFQYITIGAVIAGTLYMVGFTEWRLTQEFDDDGNKRSS